MKIAARNLETARPVELPIAGRPQLSKAVGQLTHAKRCARDAGRDVWDFAIEIEVLLREGLTKSDLRWLISKGYVEHAEESTQLRHGSRKFRPCLNLAFSNRTCFVLTDAGESFKIGPHDLPAAGGLRLAEPAEAPTGDSLASGKHPSWDAARRELRLGDRVVKRYRVPSTSQEVILAAFEEEGWPAAIDDPLPPMEDQDPKRRLRTTIQSLNTNQRSPLLHFRGDGSGERVLWERIDQRATVVLAPERSAAMVA
jgi:hypothetical protein